MGLNVVRYIFLKWSPSTPKVVCVNLFVLSQAGLTILGNYVTSYIRLSFVFILMKPRVLIWQEDCSFTVISSSVSASSLVINASFWILLVKVKLNCGHKHWAKTSAGINNMVHGSCKCLHSGMVSCSLEYKINCRDCGLLKYTDCTSNDTPKIWLFTPSLRHFLVQAGKKLIALSLPLDRIRMFGIPGKENN